jgi:histidinol-phosphate aminotransferase
MDINAIARPEIVAMRPYQSARKSSAADGILLNANESPTTLVDDPEWRRMKLNRYPIPQPAELKTRLADLYGVPESNLLVTRGSDEGIDLLTRVFCRPGEDAIVECTPCFGMYRIAATIQGARIINVPRQTKDGFRIDFGELERVIAEQDNVRLVFLTSPNNPTGELIDRDALLRVLAVCKGRALVVMDEAYIEFSTASSVCELCDQWPNLVVLRTLSKAWAAAAVRCGIVIANPAVIDLLQRVMAPYPLATVAVDAALRAISGEAVERQQRFVLAVREGRVDLHAFLEQCPWIMGTWPSQANFILVRVPDADGLVDWCAASGIRIRNFNTQAGLQGCVRLTVGSETEMTALKAALNAYGERI